MYRGPISGCTNGGGTACLPNEPIQFGLVSVSRNFSCVQSFQWEFRAQWGLPDGASNEASPVHRFFWPAEWSLVEVVITTTEQSFLLCELVRFDQRLLYPSDPFPNDDLVGFLSDVSGTTARFSLFLSAHVGRWNLDFGDGTTQLIDGSYGLVIDHTYPNQTAKYTVTLSTVNGPPPYIVGLPVTVAHDVLITVPSRSRGVRH